MENCTVNLFGRVEFGHIFCIGGTSSANCTNFKINFTDGGSEIPFTVFFNLRLREVVMSSFLNSEWRETFKYDLISVNPGDPFRLYIIVTEEKFHVALNDKHLCDYLHQTTPDNIKSIRLTGLEKVTQVDHRRFYPTPWPPIHENFDTVAFSSDVPYEFLPGAVIVLRMRLTGSSSGSFFIRFNERGTKKQVFHFNPRFAERVVVVNTMNDSSEWLKDEKRFTNFPFKLNKEFQLAIAMTSSCFKVAVDGKHLLAYDFRAVQQPLRYSDHHAIFDTMTGFKIFALQGMKLFVSHVDHFQMKEDCEFYENFSHQNFTQL